MCQNPTISLKSSDRTADNQGMRTLHILVAALILPLAALPVAATPASAVTAGTTVARMDSGTYEKRVQYHVNRVRRHRELRPLRLASCADQVAERWSRHLASTGRFYHQSMYRVLDACEATYAGETLGKGAITPRQLVRMWMHSPGHRAILVSHKPRRIGVGARLNTDGRWVTAASFMRF